MKSVFADGTVDVYKGHREVTAGWRVTLPDGKQIMGHSMTVKLAESTAKSKAKQKTPLRVEPWPLITRDTMAAHKYARKHGYSSHRELVDDVRCERSLFLANCKIEIVELVE